jgi:hypothetical protein
MKKRMAVLPLACLLGLAASADAAIITVNYSATMDLSYFGGSATSAIEGSWTWDSTAAAISSGGNFATYPIQSATLSIDSVDYTSAINLATSFFSVVDNAAGSDVVSPILLFSPKLDLDGGSDPDVNLMQLELGMPDSTLAGFGLPEDAAFVSALNFFFLNFRDSQGVGPAITKGISVTAVPEPGITLLLLGGMASAMARRRAARRS